MTNSNLRDQALVLSTKIKPALTEVTRIKVDRLDIKIAIAVGLCLLTAKFFPLIEYIPSCFAAILCMQETAKLSWKTGLIRLIITAIGGIVGILVVLLDEAVRNEWLFLLMAAAGILLTLWCCKLAKNPYIFAKIGGVTFVLVIMVMSGTERLMYAGLRLLGTFYGVVISIGVAVIGDFLAARMLIPASKSVTEMTYDTSNMAVCHTTTTATSAAVTSDPDRSL